MTPQERLDYLLSDVWQPTGKLVTISDLESALSNLDFGFVLVRLTLEASTQPQIIDGMSDAEIMATRANAMKMQDAVEAMRSGGGLSLSSPDRQAVIDQLAIAGQWPDSVRDAVKALGGVWRKQWQVEGYATEPTLESVTKQAIIDTTRTAINSKATAINAWLDAVDMSAYTEAELQAYCDDLLASEDGNPAGGE